MESYLRIGVITSSHGIRGEVKVFPTTDDPRRFSNLHEVRLAADDGAKTLVIRSVRYTKDRVLLSLEGIDTPEEANLLRQKELYIPRGEGVPLAENENYYADLIGISVLTDDGRTLGTLTEILETGANDVYVVRKPGGSEILLPAIRDCVLSVDPEAGQMLVHLMKGLE